MDVLVRNVRVGERLVDGGIGGGRLGRIGPSLDADPPPTPHAQGRPPPPPPPHGAATPEPPAAEGRRAPPPLVHGPPPRAAPRPGGPPRHNESGTLIEGIQVWGELKESLTADDVFARASEVVRWSA